MSVAANGNGGMLTPVGWVRGVFSISTYRRADGKEALPHRALRNVRVLKRERLRMSFCLDVKLGPSDGDVLRTAERDHLHDLGMNGGCIMLRVVIGELGCVLDRTGVGLGATVGIVQRVTWRGDEDSERVVQPCFRAGFFKHSDALVQTFKIDLERPRGARTLVQSIPRLCTWRPALGVRI